MKEFLKKLIKAKEDRAAAVRKQMKESQDINEVRALGDTLEAILAELQDAKDQLAQVEADEAANADNGDNGEDRHGDPAPAAGGFNPLASFGQRGGNPAAQAETNVRATMEYRKAFKDFVQRGIRNPILESRADAEGTSSDLGVLLPTTIIQEIIKGVEGVYGQLYSRVKKTNLKGGVKYPIGAFSATVYWQGTAGTDAEHGVSEKQDAGGVTSYVEFTYHIGEIRIAQSLLQTVLAVETFEREIVDALVKAYVKDMDTMILDGNGVKQPTGIFTDVAAGIQRITALSGHVISFSAADMADWTKWQSKFFAKLPIAFRKEKFQFVLTPNTFEANIMTLADSNGQPVYRETFNPVNGDETATFKGKEVVFIEEGTSVKNFDDATNNQYFGFAWVPEKAYAINTNLEFTYKKYFDNDTNQYITKALVIGDGKILDPKYIYLFKKTV